jgi:uncharacterized protein YmfQ (DUF2313 family)
VSAHRYWRVNVLTNAAGQYASLSEVVFAGWAGGASLFGTGTAICSTTQGGSNAAPSAIDGDLNSYWGSAQAIPAWWGYDFGAGVAVDVAEIRITMASLVVAYAPATWTADYSDDAVTWTTANAFTSAAWVAGAVQTFEVSVPPPGGTPHVSQLIAEAVAANANPPTRVAQLLAEVVVSTIVVPPQMFGDEDYRQAMLNLLPRGPIWRTDAASTLSNVLLALAPTYTRSTAAAAQLLVDTNPDTTVNLLTEWEESLGLPDSCSAPNPTLVQRQAAVRAKFAFRGSMSLAYFINLATELGYTITIDEFSPFVVGDTVGMNLLGPQWAFVWQINAPSVTMSYFTTGANAAGDALSRNNAGELVCRITRDAPAETEVFFVFS